MSKRTIPDRKEIPDGHKWDLGPLFESDKLWEELFVAVEKDLTAIETFKGRLHESVEKLHAAIVLHLAFIRRMEKLYTYAHLKSDEDKTNQHYLGLLQRSLNLYARSAEAASFMVPEIQSIASQRIEDFMAQPILSEYRFYLEKILRFKPHTLDERVEQILALSQEVTQASGQVFGQLDNADLKFGFIEDDDGKTIELSHANFTTLLMNPNREVRRNAFKQYYKAYADHQNTLAATLNYSVKKDRFYAQVRNFESCRAAALFGDNVPESVYENLIATVRASLEPLFKYFSLRKQVLGLADLHFYDTYVPLVPEIEFRMPYNTAVDIACEALSVLGTAYTDVLKEGLLGGWVDRFENRGKRSGAYSSGCYDSPPYILLNYEDASLNSLYTLVHEAGHSMHSYLSKGSQPYVYHDYTIFVAEVASTFNEILLGKHLLERYREDPRMRAYILNREIDNIRATLFRQTMFAEFEKKTHHIIESNQPLTLDVITETYRQLLDAYFGDTTVIDPELALECLRIPHFYSAFYVYKYATGISAAVALAKQVLDGTDVDREAYLNFLKMGGSRFPLDELIEAGVDLHSPEPIHSAIEHFDGLVDQLNVAVEAL